MTSNPTGPDHEPPRPGDDQAAVEPEPTVAPPPEPSGPAADEADEKEWWQEPGLPWKHKPTRADIACLSWIAAASIYGLILLPLRPVMLALAPHILGSLGYRTGLVMTGALASVGDPWWPLVLLLGSLAAMKFDWIYWWAGKLWGHGLIEVWSGRSDRARRRNQRAVAFAQKYETLAILVTYLPIPIPAAVVYAALGAAGTKLSKFLTVSFIGSVLSSALYMFLGVTIGEPAVELINNYGQFLWYVTLAILAGMLVVAWWRARNKKKASPVAGPPAGAVTQPERRFDPPSLYAALDAERRARGLSWAQVSAQSGVAAATLLRTRKHGRFEADGALAMARWLARPLEDFTRPGGAPPERLGDG